MRGIVPFEHVVFCPRFAREFARRGSYSSWKTVGIGRAELWLVVGYPSSRMAHASSYSHIRVQTLPSKARSLFPFSVGMTFCVRVGFPPSGKTA